ncbi:unnamed protein product [Rhodiola kirilowii]
MPPLIDLCCNLCSSFRSASPYSSGSIPHCPQYSPGEPRVGLRPLVWELKAMPISEGETVLDAFEVIRGLEENLFWGSGSDWAPAQAVGLWFAEKQWYRYWNMSCARARSVGIIHRLCGGLRSGLGVLRWSAVVARAVFITCNYDPPGNFVGEKPY